MRRQREKLAHDERLQVSEIEISPHAEENAAVRQNVVHLVAGSDVFEAGAVGAVVEEVGGVFAVVEIFGHEVEGGRVDGGEEGGHDVGFAVLGLDHAVEEIALLDAGFLDDEEGVRVADVEPDFIVTGFHG